MEVHPIGLHQGKCLKMHIPLRCNLAVKLTDRTAAQVSGILIFGIHILNSAVNPLKVRIGNDSLSPENQLSLVGNI